MESELSGCCSMIFSVRLRIMDVSVSCFVHCANEIMIMRAAIYLFIVCVLIILSVKVESNFHFRLSFYDNEVSFDYFWVGIMGLV